MLDVIVDTIVDSIKILPFLFLAYLAMEYIEHKMNQKSQEVIKKAGKVGPLVGGILGVIPQCGFSVVATNFYAVKMITLGTLISVYLSTSDEMLPILLSEAVPIPTILMILAIKLLIGIVMGFVIDGVIFLWEKKKKAQEDEIHIEEMCQHDHCDCEHDGILKSAIKHTFSILFFILLITLIINTAIYFIGEEQIASFIASSPVFGPILACLIGIIPNCAASVVLTQLWIGNIIPVSTMIGGLLVNAGVGLLVLFRVNKDWKKNIGIICLLLIIGFVSAISLQAIGIQNWI